MAVFTPLGKQDIESILDQFNIGKLVRFSAIGEGIENTNYFVDTIKDEASFSWVLTLFENLSDDDIPYFCALTEHLDSQKFKVPAPIKNNQNDSIIKVKDRTAVIVPKLEGSSRLRPSTEDCRRIGVWLARMHLSQLKFKERRSLVRDEAWMLANSERLRDFMNPDEWRLLNHYIDRYKKYRSGLEQCPQGTVHGDLFRDNVLFVESEISGVIDFYHACDATLLFDLAVVANDWCTTDVGYDQDRLSALVGSYQSIRPWTEKEQEYWAYCLELAALRFWISRLTSQYVPGYQNAVVEGETIKDPDEMKKLLPSIHLD